ncbi:MAG: Hsp20/alpha crystallin family protein [Phenylobacterium sp.]
MANRDLTPWTGGRSLSPFGRDPFTGFRREMDRLFDDFFAPMEPRSFAGGNGGALAALTPSIDLHETDQAYELTAELPGLEQKDVELTLRDNALILSGEKRQERNDEDGGRHWSERSFGRFERVIPLEGEVDADKVQAGFKNGVLKVTLPKNPKAQDKTRRIEIKPET